MEDPTLCPRRTFSGYWSLCVLKALCAPGSSLEMAESHGSQHTLTCVPLTASSVQGTLKHRCPRKPIEAEGGREVPGLRHHGKVVAVVLDEPVQNGFQWASLGTS